MVATHHEVRNVEHDVHRLSVADGWRLTATVVLADTNRALIDTHTQSGHDLVTLITLTTTTTTTGMTSTTTTSVHHLLLPTLRLGGTPGRYRSNKLATGAWSETVR
jgi:hypothetical protein